MNRSNIFPLFGLCAFALSALSCSGGGGGGTGITGASASASVSSGAITGFGSVKLTGKEYQTQNSAFVVDGQAGVEADLKIGMVVTVNGLLFSDGTRTASIITQEDVVEGEIQAIPGTNDRLVILGQTVLIDNGTVFDNNIVPQNITGLAVGDLVEVNGFVTGKGLIRATRIEKKGPPVTCEVNGIVENHNSGLQTITIGALTVNYAGADISDMPNPAVNPWNDLLVEVKGNPCTQVAAPFLATKVEPEGINAVDADEAEVEGAITLFNSAASFSVRGVPVVTNAKTIFEGGDPGDLALGVEVEVEGVLANGVLTAEEVSFRDNVEIEGDAATVNAGGPTPNLTVSGLPGITVFVDVQTEFKGGIANLGQLMPNDHVRVRGRPTGVNTVIAAEVDQRSPDSRVILEGTVQASANPFVTILGFAVDTSLIPDNEFKGPSGGAIGRAAFFSQVKVGTLVKARGNLSPGPPVSIIWDRIEIEGEDD